jgi:hypothetical protein
MGAQPANKQDDLRQEKSKMEISETKNEYKYDDYTARTYFGEYGVHTDWFKGQDSIKSDEVPDAIQDKHDADINEVI